MEQSRVPPHSEEAEKGVLGAIILNAGTVLDLCVDKKINMDDFYIPAHAKIIGAIGTMMAQDHRSIDILTITEVLKQKGDLESIGGALFLDRLIDSCPTAANAEYYIDIVKKMSMRRNIISCSRTAEAEAYNCDDPEELRSRIEMELTNMERRVKAKDIAGVYREIDDDIQSSLRGEPREIGISTCYDKIDNAFEGGMRNGGVYWLSGEESSGKTSLKCNIIDRLLITQPEIRIADLTLEMTRRAELEKLLGIHADTNISRIIRGKGQSNVKEIPKAADLLVHSKRLIIEDQQNVLTTTELVSWGRRMVSKYGVKLLVIDYFQKLNVPGGEKMTMEKETSLKSKTVIDLAGKLKVPILCVAATNEHGKIRGSRQADYDGEGHLRLSDKTDGEAAGPHYVYDIEAFSQKARFGRKNVRVPLQLFGVTGRFEEEKDEYAQAELG